MPTIAWFYGIAVRMFYDDHEPPHVHAQYGRAKALLRIADGAVIAGALPSAAENMVRQWIVARRAELDHNWRRARNHEPLDRIAGPMAKAEFPLVDVLKLRPLGGYRLWLRFTDGREGVRDFGSLVNEPGPMLEPLRDPDYFSRVFLEMGAPTWPNGFDIDPIHLYMQMRDRGELTRAAAE